ncbi:MAG: Uma2 family endonuclease [Chloroflexi bacterium]|nr:Uma2 family endonuclease [Chloroflexota bacterium]
MRTKKTTLTAEELLRLSTTGSRYELVKGELFEMPPAGGRHGGVAMQIGALLNAYVRAHSLGQVFAAETGFILRRDPDTVRAPDAAFVAKDRLPAGELPPGYLEMVPDLAVEVVSPGDSAREVREKVADWMRAGVRLLWAIDPATRSVTVYRSTDDFSVLSEDASLDGGQVIPGFSTNIKDLFS